MEIEQVRKDMIRRFTDLEPELSPDVIDDATYNSVYLTPFRARNIRALNKYEEKHSVQFCMDCRGKDDKTDKITAYRAYVTESDNLLENVPNAHIRIQCFHCDFDLRFEKPKPKPSPSNMSAEHMSQLADLMGQNAFNSEQLKQFQQYAQGQMAAQSGLASAYGSGYGQAQGLLGGISAGEMEARQREYNERMRHMVDAARYQAFPPTIIKPAQPLGAVSEPPPERSFRDDILKKLREG